MSPTTDPAIIVLKALLKKNKLTYADLRNQIGTKSYVSLILSGERNLTRSHIQKLSTRFKISPEIFFDQQAAKLYAGRKIKVPVVDLLNPDIEPEPTKVDALLYDVALKASAKAQKAHEDLMDNLKKTIQKAVAQYG